MLRVSGLCQYDIGSRSHFTQLTEIDRNVNVRCIAPDVVPDGRCVRLDQTAAILDAATWEVAVEINKEAIGGAGEEVPLIQEVALRILRGQADHSSVEVPSGHCLVQLPEDVLDNRYRVELISMDRSRKRELAAVA